jgi:hypothetical protein
MNGLTKSEVKTLAYLSQMFPGYAWGKTAGGGQLDFMGAPPPGTELPMLFVESKCGGDRTRESQNSWAKSEIGLRCRKFVVYSPDDEVAPCFLYTWDDWLLFVESEDVVARTERKNAERRASTGLAPGLYVIKQDRGADATMRIADDGTCTVLAGSLFRSQEGSGVSANAAAVRKDLLRLGKLVADGEALRLTQDTEFTSPSAAAGVVFGRSANGPANWKKCEPVENA